MKVDGGDVETQDIEWPEPKRSQFPSTLGGAVEYSLTHVLWSVLSLLDQPLITLGGWMLRVVLKVVEKSAAPFINPVLDEIIEATPADSPMLAVYKEMRSPSGEAGAGILSGASSAVTGGGISAVIAPFIEESAQWMWRKKPVRLYDIMTYVAEFWRGKITRDQLTDGFARQGHFPEGIDGLVETVRPRVGGAELASWYLRDKSRDGEFVAELLARGYPEEEIDKIKELLDVIPGPQDIIRMAVREAWRDDFAAAWGTDQDLPPQVAEWAEKVGLSADWVKRYWRAHWELPSVMMGYEMLHRGVIDQDQLKELMRALDIMPGWRDKLIEISYNVFTRVDVRRMHKMGILDEAGVKTSYMEQGYDEDKATKMTEFTIAINTEEEREATKGDILTAYEEGVISRDEAEGFLSDIGYQELWIETYLAKIDHKLEEEARKEEEKGTDEELVKERELTKADILSSYEDKVISRDDAAGYLAAILYPASVIELLLTKVDYKLTQKLIREEIETTRVLYVNEDIDVSGVHVRLGKYALPATQIAELITLWNFERERKTERPSISQCLAFYYDAIYTEEKLREQMAKHKLSPEYIEDFVADANYLILKREQAELERQQKEQERIDESAFKTDRMVQIAALNVNIQEYKVFIADQKVAMLHVIDPEEKKTMTEDMIIAAAEIVHLQLEIARVPVVPPE